MPDDNEKQPADAPSPKDGPGPLADHPVLDEKAPEAGEQSPLTDTGLPVEEQVRKEWDPNKDGGLPTLLKGRAK